jgi:hypothetical protein
MPTFADAFVAELAHSGILKRWKPFEALSEELRKIPVAMFLMATAIANRAEEHFPSKAYGPYFEARGFVPFLARGLGSLTISVATRESDEAKRVTPVVEAIRFLAQGERQRRAILSRAKLVVAASKEASVVDELFRNAGLHEGEFLGLLQTVIDGGAISRERIRTIAAAVAPTVRRARGRKIAAASGAHELFLETNLSFGLPGGYTWSEDAGDFVDQKTQATRQEFGDPDFAPRSARRRVKRRGLVKTGLSRSTIR